MKDLILGAMKEQRTEIKVKDVVIGGKEIVLIGGPCAVESNEQMKEAAQGVKLAGGKVLRGGVFKPRTSPYSFQGLGSEGVTYLKEAAYEQNLLTVTEVMDPAGLEAVLEHIDIIQIGARNMQNFQLLKLVGETQKPVILKRGLSATVEEWLLAAEYILAGGNPNVILCERGIRTFEPSTRNTLDLSAVVLAKQLSHLPVIVDPSHATGRVDLIPALAKAAVAAGADGLLIEMHPNPSEAMSDGAQSLTIGQFMQLAQEIEMVAQTVQRTFGKSGSFVEDKRNKGIDSLEINRDNPPHDLNGLRSQIDEIDQTIIQLLAKRMKVVEHIGEQKSIDRIRDAMRENEIMERLVSLAAEVECPVNLIREIYAHIFHYSVQSQILGKLTQDRNLTLASR